MITRLQSRRASVRAVVGPLLGVAAVSLVVAGCGSGSTAGTSSAPTGAQAGAGVAASGVPAPAASGAAASGAASGTGSTGPGSATATPSPTATPVVIPAKVGDCFNYKSIDHFTLDEATKVACSKKHTATTVYVGSLTDLNAISFEQAGDIDARARKAGGLNKLPATDQSAWAAYAAALAPVSAECDKAIVKATRAKLPNGVVSSSLFTSDMTGPSQAEWDKGARWVRCNTVAHLVPDDFNPNTPLIALPVPLKNALTKTTAFRNCWIPLQQNKKVRSVSCTSKTAGRGAWLTLSDQLATPKSAWPGQKGAVAAAKQPCLNLTRHFTSTRSITARWWVWHVAPDGTPKSGGSKATWGTPNSHFGCAMPNWQFGAYH